MKNWIGNSNSIFKTIGASAHSKKERQKHDYYATDPSAIDDLFKRETFNKNIWECACGEGHLSKRMLELGKPNGLKIFSTDLINRGYGKVADFLSIEHNQWNGDIITNPPYRYAQEFVEKSLDIIPLGNKVAMFLKLTFLEGQKRKQMFLIKPPKKIYVYSKRKQCAKGGEFKGSSAVAYAWYVWEKGYKGNPEIEWI